MKKFDGFKSEAQKAGVPMLPAGAYIAGIQAVKIEGTEPDQRLVLRLEIIEGDWAGYYARRYENDAQSAARFHYEAKYKGDFRIQIPDRANTKREHFDWDLRNFNGSIWAIEQSNEGYSWDWDEKKLKGKTVGISVREGSYNGSPYTTIGRLESAEEVRQGKVKPMKPMKPRSDAAEPQNFVEVEEEEIPF